jgi:hypothetical protein
MRVPDAAVIIERAGVQAWSRRAVPGDEEFSA